MPKPARCPVAPSGEPKGLSLWRLRNAQQRVSWISLLFGLKSSTTVAGYLDGRSRP